MVLPTSYCSPEEMVCNAKCLLDHLEKVRGYLRRGKGFTDHAIEHAVTVVYCVAMPYIKGTKMCEIENRRAWVFKVAIRAASRAARHEVDRTTIEPAVLAATVIHPGRSEEQWDISEALKLLTKQQSDAVALCILGEMSQRAAAKQMGIAVSTLCGHLNAAKERLKEILPALMPTSWRKHYDPSARASQTVEKGNCAGR
jgi:DNA-directed RNA polymerase specialized sigma24 family protein